MFVSNQGKKKKKKGRGRNQIRVKLITAYSISVDPLLISNLACLDQIVMEELDASKLIWFPFLLVFHWKLNLFFSK